VVAGDVQREAHGRRKRRLEPARLGRAQPLAGQAELRAEGDQALQRLGLVAVARDGERARGPVADVVAELGREGGEALRGADAQGGEGLVARLGLGHRREHAGRDLPRPRLAGVHDADAQAAPGGAPGAGEPDDPAAGDDDVRRVRPRCAH
jgi:hypothetical protein